MGFNYNVEVWDEKPHEVPTKSEVSLTVTGVVNRNTGVPTFRGQMGKEGLLLPDRECTQTPWNPLSRFSSAASWERGIKPNFRVADSRHLRCGVPGFPVAEGEVASNFECSNYL